MKDKENETPRRSVGGKKKDTAKGSGAKFSGEGTDYKGKLIGVADVAASSGDAMCAEALQKLKMDVRSSGEHKPKLIINISLEGLKLVDERSSMVLHTHPVHKISFITRDLTDNRAFGYIYGTPQGTHKFFAIKTAQTADTIVLAIKELFEIIYEMKMRERRAHSDSLSKQEPLKTIDKDEDHYKVPPQGEPRPVLEFERSGSKSTIGDTSSSLDSDLENIRQGMDSMQQMSFADHFSSTPDISSVSSAGSKVSSDAGAGLVSLQPPPPSRPPNTSRQQQQPPPPDASTPFPQDILGADNITTAFSTPPSTAQNPVSPDEGSGSSDTTGNWFPVVADPFDDPLFNPRADEAPPAPTPNTDPFAPSLAPATAATDLFSLQTTAADPYAVFRDNSLFDSPVPVPAPVPQPAQADPFVVPAAATEQLKKSRENLFTDLDPLGDKPKKGKEEFFVELKQKAPKLADLQKSRSEDSDGGGGGGGKNPFSPEASSSSSAASLPSPQGLPPPLPSGITLDNDPPPLLPPRPQDNTGAANPLQKPPRTNNNLFDAFDFQAENP